MTAILTKTNFLWLGAIAIAVVSISSIGTNSALKVGLVPMETTIARAFENQTF